MTSVRWRYLSDAQLVEAATAPRGDLDREKALTVIFIRHQAQVVAYCRKRIKDQHRADDVVQETFDAAFAELRAGRPPRRQDTLAPWLIGIASHRCLQAFAGDRQARGLIERIDDDLSDVDDGFNAQRDFVMGLIREVNEALSEADRKIFEIYLLRGLRGDDFASAYGLRDPARVRTTLEAWTKKTANGFGALVLARYGSSDCRKLAVILRAADVDRHLTRELRERLVGHIGQCRTCRAERDRVVARFQPVLIPVIGGSRPDEVVGSAVQEISSRGARPRGRARPLRTMVAGLSVITLAIGGAWFVERQNDDETELDGAQPLEDATLLSALTEPPCAEVEADVFPRNDIEGWVNEELNEHHLTILGMDVGSRSIDLVATPNELAPTDQVIALFVRDGRIVEKLTYVSSSTGDEPLRMGEILDAVYPAEVLLDDLPHRQGADVTFRQAGVDAQGDPAYIFEDCFSS